ncbi:MFS transporter [Aldersonia sp. NBC_00410]|uniref:MFS transporter n=1 Tax=Aldersonia sp. NBC_00410 TaxID=2975954 RepID=UPI00225AA94F|nr:MFS transporter [Aldersonia sp. NBC_00410]MCX5043628.1 MFS transporter [Aldersonia sp. NBC_00410]
MAPDLRAARAGVFGIFGLNGFMLAMWVVHIPVISERADVSKATLGMLLLFLAGGALIGMQLSGPLADRFGSRTIVGVAAVTLCATVLGPGFATNAVALGAALVAFGFANGALDVSMNAQAVHVEQRYGRPILSAFHALFSCGGLAGSLCGAATLALGWDVRATLLVAATVGFAVTAGCTSRMLGHVPERHTDTAAPTRGSRMILVLGLIAFALLMSEGVATDWSTLQVKEHLGTSDATAALAFGAFSVMMTVGRFGADRVSAAIGPMRVVRYGTLIAAVGITMVMLSVWPALTLAGWALFGLGLSGGVPQIFTAAGNLSGSPGTNMSRVFTMGYLGLLAGPAIIGWLTKLVPLTSALVVPLVAVLLTAIFARVVEQPNA